MTKLTRVLLLGVLILAIGLPALAQSARGTITGLLKDASGAVVPGADIAITEKSTGAVIRAVSTQAGVYRAPYIPAGTYKITAALAGFKTAVADNIQVMVGQTVTVDFNLEVGQISDQVTVMAETPLLESSTSEIGINTTEKEVHTWPILVGDGTRQLQQFMFTSLPGTQGGTFAGSINGGQAYSHEILIEGISIGRFDLNGGSNNEFTPTMDAVSEFKLQTGALSSQYGNTQTALTNFGMKSGTNEYHGTAFWFHKQPRLNANSWAFNRTNIDPETGKAPKAPGARENNYGGTVGGPIIKDRTFFFFSVEIERYSSQLLAGSRDSFPIGAFNRGDFSKLLDPAFTQDSRSGTVVGQDALGRDVVFGQIYNPATSRQLADGSWIRDPFPGNIVPTDMWSNVSKNVLKHKIPDAEDLPGGSAATLRRNGPRFSGCCPFMDIDNISFKVDHVVSTMHKLSTTFVTNGRIRLRDGHGGSGYRIPGPIPGPYASGDKTQDTPGYIVRVAEDWTISPTVINHFAYGYNRFRNANQSNSYIAGIDWGSELGLKGTGGTTFPEIRYEGFNATLSGGYLRMGHQGTGNAPNGSNIVSDDLTWIKGSHSFRFGFEHRRYYLNDQSVTASGQYRFHNENTGIPGFTDSTGFAYASFLLGAIRQASLGVINTTPGIRSRTTAFYFQDDWKARRNLTLNFGLRWDIPTALTEVAQRQSGLDPTAPNPGADNYPGALVYLGDCPQCTGKGRFADPYYKQFGPRVGFAWSPGDSNKLVVRGGYGINFAPPLQDGWNYGYDVGFNGSNFISARSGRFQDDPSYFWDNTFPAFEGTLPNYDPTLLNGDTISWYQPELTKYPYVQNWNFGIQYELPWETKVEANYVGNKGTRLSEPPYLWAINQLHPSYLSLGDTLLDDISDHPEIRKPYPSFEGTVAQALRPFPQYYGVGSHRSNNGWSTYNSMQLTVTKRSRYGLSFLAAYTFSKALGTGDTSGPGNYYDYGQDFYNRRADYSVTQYHVPHDLKLTWIYDLPFGPQGRWLRDGVASAILGGWTMSAIHRYSSGSPLSIGTGGYDSEALFNPGFRADVLLPADQHVLAHPTTVDPVNGTPYLNPAAFGSPPKTANNVPVRLGNAPRWMPNLRGFMIHSEDFSLIKRTALGFREGANFEIRMDVVNLFNRVRLGNPSTDANDPDSFGRIYGKSGSPRSIQLGVRISF